MAYRALKNQWLNFWFIVNETKDDESGDDAERGYPLWKAAVELLEHRHAQHPLYRYRVHEHDMELDIERWEFCEQTTENEARDDGLLLWAVSFYRDGSQGFEPEVIRALRDLCIECFAEAAKTCGGTARYAQASTCSNYTESVEQVLEGV